MQEYLIWFAIVIVFGGGPLAAVYVKFKRGLETKIYSLISVIATLAGIISFIMGKEGINAKLFAVTGIPLLVVGTVFVLYFLRSLVIPLKSAVAALSTSTTQISSTAKQSAATATQQAATVTEVSSTIEEINQTSKSAADNARKVVVVAEEAVQGGSTGQEAVKKAVSMMESIHSQVQGVTEQIMRLNDKNAQIVNIVESVNKLAEQSNLLAVNASIEAAKAGEHGRGFSVVAAEVRNLAKQSQGATQQIRNLLSEIEKESGKAVSSTDEALRRAREGRTDIESVQEVLKKLANVLDLTADKARQIFGSATQQAAGIEQISDAMESVAQGGSESAAGARQLEEAVHGLDSFARQINRIITGKEDNAA